MKNLITKKMFNKLKFEDRVEYRQKLSIINNDENYGKIISFICLCSSLLSLVSLWNFLIGFLISFFFLVTGWIGLYLTFSFEDKHLKELNKEYFNINL